MLVNKSKIFDCRHSVPVYTATSIETSLPFFDGVDKRVRIFNPNDYLPVDALLVNGVELSRRLIISFHGAIDRRSIDIPRFEWQSQLKDRPEHKLYIADTTLEISEHLNLAWYIGTPKFDLSASIKSFIDHVVKINKIDEIVLIGSSGGGFAAMKIGAHLENACSLVFSPQTDIWEFTEAHSKAFIDATFDDLKDNDCLVKESMKTRTDLVEVYRFGHHKNKYIYYQNTGDHDHVINHKKRFAESQGVRLPSGRSFNQMGRFISEFDGVGHVRPPVNKVDSLLNLSFEMIGGKKQLLINSSKVHGHIDSVQFNTGCWKLENIPHEWFLYSQSHPYKLPSPSDTLSYNHLGVPQRIIDGVVFDHPVLQAQTALKFFNNINHILLKDDAVLFVKKTIDHLLSYSEVINDALFFPFSFEWHQGHLVPPWYSAMAQGQVLSLVCRAVLFSGLKEFESTVDLIFNSFLHVRDIDSNEIGVVNIDAEGYLWFEEYPYPTFNKFVLNGHIFSLVGIYEYWVLTGSKTAEKMVTAGLLTVSRYFVDFRNPGWSSNYNLWDKLLIRNYHQTHIMQFEFLYQMTGDFCFTRCADLLDSDFPNSQNAGHVYLSPGIHTVYRADNTRLPTKIVESIEISIPKAVAYTYAVRTKFEEHEGVYMLVESSDSSCNINNLWVKEILNISFPKLCIDRRKYLRPRKFVSKGSSLEVNGFSKYGQRENIRLIDTHLGCEFDVLEKAIWNGEIYIKLRTDFSTLSLNDESWYKLRLNQGILY